MNQRPDWRGTFRDHITKQLQVRDRAVVEMSGFRAEVRQIGESWLWTIVRSDTGPSDTSLAAGCEATADEAAFNTAEALAAMVRSAAIG